MANKPIAADLIADLPENWAYGQTVAPTGAEAGLPEQYGFNYLMQKVNAALEAVNAINNAFPGLTAAALGAVPTGGNAGSATKLETARTIRTNLGSTAAVSFDGTGNVTPGVTGTLPVARGGTGVTTLEALAQAIYGTSTSPLSKPNILADTTATGMGLTAAATPNEAFNKLWSLISTAQETADGKPNIAYGVYTGAQPNTTENVTKTFSFSFDPVFLIAGEENVGNTNNGYVYFMVRGSTKVVALAGMVSSLPTVTWGSKSVSIKGQYAYLALNSSSKKYQYLAIG